MVRAIRAVVVCVAVLASAAPASAQIVKWTDNGFVAVSGGVQVTGQDVSSVLSKGLYDETATLNVDRRVPGGLFFDIAAGKRVWNNTGVGFTFSRRSNKNEATVNASIPDPTFFDQPRLVTTKLADMKFSETLFAPIALMGFPVTDVIDAIGFIGPLVRSVNQELVSDFTVTEGNPVGVTPTRTELSKKFLGIQIGVDLQYRLTKEFAAGGFVRYSGGGGNLSNDVKIEAPGVQIGVGGRYKF
jgi:hypothetical protein